MTSKDYLKKALADFLEDSSQNLTNLNPDKFAFEIKSRSLLVCPSKAILVHQNADNGFTNYLFVVGYGSNTYVVTIHFNDSKRFFRVVELTSLLGKVDELITKSFEIAEFNSLVDKKTQKIFRNRLFECYLPLAKVVQEDRDAVTDEDWIALDRRLKANGFEYDEQPIVFNEYECFMLRPRFGVKLNGNRFTLTYRIKIYFDKSKGFNFDCIERIGGKKLF